MLAKKLCAIFSCCNKRKQDIPDLIIPNDVVIDIKNVQETKEDDK
jgi:hypothetical protein